MATPAVRTRVIDQRVVVDELPIVDEVETVERAARDLRVEQHAQVVARHLRIDHDGEGGVLAVPPLNHLGGRNV
jgi:hypothetical protein